MPDQNPAAPSPGEGASPAFDLAWVWREVRKRVFIKLSYSIGMADAMEAAVPITLEKNHFVVGLKQADYHLAHNLTALEARNTIENILRAAAGHPITFEVIEGVTLHEWEAIRDRRARAQDAFVALAGRDAADQHFEAVLTQITGEIRHRVSALQDRALPRVRARLLLEIVSGLADAEEMLFDDVDTREAKKAMGRVVDRIASFLEVPPMTLALEIERYRREHPIASHKTDSEPTTPPSTPPI
jgi:hypothetical protein